MPRYARLHTPGALVHVIARFVDREKRLASPDDRAFFLDRLERALRRTDWTLYSYGLMETHTHLAARAGEDPPKAWLSSLHTSVGLRLSARAGGLGSVFAGRAKTIVMPIERMGILVPYIHNNPERAGLVDDPASSDWTSHRAWIGLDPPPSFLRVEEGLALAGFDASPRGRAAFDSWVRARAGDPPDPTLSAEKLDALRADCRRRTGLPVELSSPIVEEPGVLRVELLHAAHHRPVWRGDLEELLRATVQVTGVSLDELRSRSTAGRLVGARRVLAIAGVILLRRPVVELAHAMFRSESAVSRLVQEPGTALETARLVVALLGV